MNQFTQGAKLMKTQKKGGKAAGPTHRCAVRALSPRHLPTEQVDGQPRGRRWLPRTVRTGILLGVTDPVSLRLMEGFPDHLTSQGWQVTVVAGGPVPHMQSADTIVVPMRRDPSPVADVVALVRWSRALYSIRPAHIMVGTPKAGLLGIVAGWLTRVPRRTYLLRGMRLESTTGGLRTLLWLLERLTCTLATDILAISPSLANRTTELRLAAHGKVQVLANGSSNGVDSNKYRYRTNTQKRTARTRLGIADETFVVGYVGRLHVDKGIDTLLGALRSLNTPQNTLLLIAGKEEGFTLEPRGESGAEGPKIVTMGELEDVRDLYNCIDILCLPSRREGFGNVVIEAGAMGVPAIVSDATGCRDTVVPGKTGWRVPVGDVEAWAAALHEAYSSPDETSTRGIAAHDWVHRNFNREDVWAAYDDHLGPPPSPNHVFLPSPSRELRRRK